MQVRHEAEAEALLKSYTIHSSRTEHGESAEPQTAPPFAHFEQLCASHSTCPTCSACCSI